MDNKEKNIAVVDKNDNVYGYLPKIKVHREGLLHRAFSIFIFDNQQNLLLQKRAMTKYHSAGLWTNTCCSHFVEGYKFEDYIHERLKWEMGFDCLLNFQFSFEYNVDFDNGLKEHEIDHVYFGSWNGTPIVNECEVDSYMWKSVPNIKADIIRNSQNYTYWFREIIKNI